jgi:hypothetical protein
LVTENVTQGNLLYCRYKPIQKNKKAVKVLTALQNATNLPQWSPPRVNLMPLRKLKGSAGKPGTGS